MSDTKDEKMPVYPPPEARPHQLSEEELSAIYRAKLLWRLLVTLLIVGGILGLTFCVSGIIVIRATQVHATELVERVDALTRETHATTELIQSCVDPTGACKRQGTRATGKAVSGITSYDVAASSCAAKFIVNGLAERLSQKELTVRISACATRQLTQVTRR